jgi:RNA polymerase sigma factor (sigma-70 family)
VAGAPDDLTRFCESEWSRLVGMLGLYTGDRELAQDLAQQAVERTCKHWRRVRGLDAPDAWLHRVARNLAHSHFRRKRAEARAVGRHGIQNNDGGCETAEVLAMRAAVAALPLRERDVIIWRFYLGCSVRETAVGLGCPEGTVKTLASRAITRLRSAGLVEEAFDG